jgi:hypothetical protein
MGSVSILVLEISAVEYEGAGLGLPEAFRCKRRCIRSFSAGVSMLIRRAGCDQRVARMSVRKSARKGFGADKTVNLIEWAQWS